MAWAGIVGHDDVVERFRRACRHGRLASTFLFVGPAGIGKRSLALRLAQALLCETNPEQLLAPCGHCPACQQVEALSHPDLVVVSKPADKSFIPLEFFIGDKEHRMREGLCHHLSLKPFRGGRKIAIIDDADFLNQEGANCLLKTLEEPPPRSVLILIGTSEQRQLPTIRSRSQAVRFRPLPEETVADLLLSTNVVSDAEVARRLAELAGGSLALAADLSDEAVGDFRQTLLNTLCRPDWQSVEFAKEVTQFVDAAGKEAPPRRVRMIQLMGFAMDFYRGLLRSLCGAPIRGDEVFRRAVAAAHQSWRGDEESAGSCLERCLDAMGHVQASANQAALLDCWLDELCQMTRTGRPLVPADGTNA